MRFSFTADAKKMPEKIIKALHSCTACFLTIAA